MKRLSLVLTATIFAISTHIINAQSVTVSSLGTGDYTSVNDAILAVGSDVANPDIITILDDGPFLENRIIVNAGSSGTDDLTIQASPGVRPLLIIDMSASGSKGSAVYLRKSGNLTFKDCIIIPTAVGVVSEATYLDKVAEAGVQIDDNNDNPSSVTLQNILISSNDGTGHPVASLDGLTSPTFTPNTITFRDEGITVSSAQKTQPRNLYMYDVVVSGVAGDQGSDGIRGFIDGSPGSEWIIGPGCVVSYCNHNEDVITSATSRGAFQPGGNDNLAVKILGSQDNPVKFINNNLNGIAVTGTTPLDSGLVDVQWLIVANNSGSGFRTLDDDQNINFTNVTFANNRDGALTGMPNPAAIYTASNVIFAGDGNTSDLGNVVRFVPTGLAAGSYALNITDSAGVLAGPYSLNTVDYGSDGFLDDSNTHKTGIITSDPQFLSLDPTNGGFAVIGNLATYGTAGPAGGPLIGGGKIAPARVNDWQLF